MSHTYLDRTCVIPARGDAEEWGQPCSHYGKNWQLLVLSLQNVLPPSLNSLGSYILADVGRGGNYPSRDNKRRKRCALEALLFKIHVLWSRSCEDDSPLAVHLHHIRRKRFSSFSVKSLCT